MIEDKKRKDKKKRKTAGYFGNQNTVKEIKREGSINQRHLEEELILWKKAFEKSDSPSFTDWVRKSLNAAANVK